MSILGSLRSLQRAHGIACAAGAEGESRLREVIAGAAAAAAVAAVGLPAPLALGQARVIPLLVADPAGPDIGPVEEQFAFRVAVSRAPESVAAAIEFRGFVPMSAAPLNLGLIATAGGGGGGGGGGSLVSIARTLDPVPGNLGVFGERFADIGTNARGDVFFTDASGTQAAQVIWRARAGVFARMTRFSQQVQGMPGAVLSGIVPGTLVAGEGGEALFGSSISRSPVTFPAEIDRGLFVSRGGVVECVARSGVAAAGLGGVERYLFNAAPAGLMSAAGEVAFRAGFSTADAFQYGGTGIWMGPVGAAALVARTGEPASAAFPAGSTRDNVELRALTGSGLLVIEETARTPAGTLPRAILTGGPGALVPAVFHGQVLAEIAPFAVSSVGAFSMNDAGEWVSVLGNTRSSQLGMTSGVWRSQEGTATALAIAGTAVDASVRYANTPAFGAAVIDRRGDVLYTAQMRSFVTGTPIGNWVWFVTRSGMRRAILRQGDMIDLPGGARAITAITGGPGQPDPRGWVTLNVTLAGGASGIVLVNPRGCEGDHDGDGVVNADDLSSFVTCFFGEATAGGTCIAADFNLDGRVDADDLADFIAAYFECV